jgi:hypothetical protein
VRDVEHGTDEDPGCDLDHHARHPDEPAEEVAQDRRRRGHEQDDDEGRERRVRHPRARSS